MSELDNQVEQEELEMELETPEIEDVTPEVDPIGNFIDSIAAGDFNQSEKLFNDLLADKVADSLEAEKIAVADTIFNGVEPEVEEDSQEPEMELEEPETELDEE